MGKSSLRVQTMRRLEAEGFACAAVDLTAIGSRDITREQWYAGIVYTLANGLNLLDDLDVLAWWCDRDSLSPAQRLAEFIREVLLVEIKQNLVIFIDEIDSVLSLNFQVDDFFALIRSFYNKRADYPDYQRLTFALLGVATPSDLIQHIHYSTPFNIGRAIELTGFQLQQAQPLARGFANVADNPEAAIAQVLSWTGGQPFLTQKVCQLLLKNGSEIPAGREGEVVEDVVRSRILENWEANDEPEHLRTIRSRFIADKQRAGRLLKLYRQILERGAVAATDSPEQMELRLTGAVIKQQGELKICNRIYQTIFDRQWLEETAAEIGVRLNRIQAPPLSRQDYYNRQVLLNKVSHYWVKGVLETALCDRVLIDLGMEEQQEAVVAPLQVVLETMDDSPTPLPSSMKPIDFFDQLGEGRSLLILGEPGAGKTITLLELTRDLIARAHSDVNEMIPVVFNLSSWGIKKQSIADWLVEELRIKYQIPQAIGLPWLEQQQLLLLLDGLDEVRGEAREACIVALNQFHQDYCPEIVVASRIEDYSALSNRLNFQSAVRLRSLTLEQVYHYLDRIDSNRTGLSKLVAGDKALQELAKSPLMLNIITLAYQGIAPEHLPQTNRIEERRKQLFEAYIERMFRRRVSEQPYSREQTMRWLSWLARKLVRESQTIFLIERMQPNWLETTAQRWLYASGIGLIIGLAGGIGFGIIIWLLVERQFGLLAGLTFGIGSGVASALIFGWISDQISPIETLKWSWREAKNNLKLGLIIGAIGAIIVEIGSILYYNLLLQLQFSLAAILTDGLRIGVSVALVFILLRGLTGSTIENKTVPNQGIWQSVKYSLVLALAFAVGLTIGSLIVSIPLFGGVMAGLSIGSAISGLLIGLVITGEAWIKHLILRLICYAKGYIPWNYARFLDYATDRIFLRKVGGGYIFIHRLLMEHFAKEE
jgi:hypothetical protein